VSIVKHHFSTNVVEIIHPWLSKEVWSCIPCLIEGVWGYVVCSMFLSTLMLLLLRARRTVVHPTWGFIKQTATTEVDIAKKTSTSYYNTVTLQHSTTHCNTLQHTAKLCNILKHSAAPCSSLHLTATRCNTLRHTTIRYNNRSKRWEADFGTTLQCNATHCKALQHAATHCNTLQHTTTRCNTLQHAATRCNKTNRHREVDTGSTLQNTAKCCKTMHYVHYQFGCMAVAMVVGIVSANECNR
jgi:hypothetical protein